MQINLKIRQQRLKRGLSEAELARLVNVQQPYISKIENGQKSPNHITLALVAKALGCSIEDLIEYVD